ncbi:hypothetical protein LY76DRAFT_588103 [Colletotrichum caudatum]|nr:hypothetical protein LY76DRAFT_588103 [Colletotrichum caudatum]
MQTPAPSNPAPRVADTLFQYASPTSLSGTPDPRVNQRCYWASVLFVAHWQPSPCS